MIIQSLYTAINFLYLVPALAMLIAWLWLGEVPSAVSLAGGTLVIAGVIWVNTARSILKK
ncbi:MAG TPA: EamA family transporter [Ardenticatenaceae bacterium]|nr:EamA family transporter [Ardenticatenaceae bacterium]